MKEPTDELTAHSIEWVRDVIARWISQNETAQQLQRMMPHYVYEHVSSLTPGHDALPMAMALSMHPDSVIEARAWLESAHAQVSALASLSHPTRIMDVKRGDEKTGQAVEDEVQAELAALRREIAQNGRRLDAVIERLRHRVAEGSRRSADPAA